MEKPHSLLMLLSLTTGALLLYLYWRRRTSKSEGAIDAPNVLFFPDTNTGRNGRGACDTLFNALSSAGQSLSVCVFAFSSWPLVNILVNAHQRGVIVRVITDGEQMRLSTFQIEKLRGSGIQVRHNRSAYLMHHKFALIDGSRLVDGSLNWTQQGMHGNQENVIISSDARIVTPFKEHFEKLWEMYNPQKYCASDLNA